MVKRITLFFALFFVPLLSIAQQSDSLKIEKDSLYDTEEYDELMYMSTVYPVEYVDEKSPEIISATSHLPGAKDLAKAVKPVTYDMIFAVADHKGLIYVEADPDQEVKAVHVVNPHGFEVLCFPRVVASHHLIRLDLSSLGAGRYTLILDGRYVSTRDISINDKNLIARLH
jgi:hypothetical protein